jgi:hypothetical protein
MKGRSAQREQFARSEDDRLELYGRLVELQKQMIDLVQQNAEAERECAQLRAQLDRESEALFRSTRSLRSRLRRAAAQLLKRRPADPAEVEPAPPLQKFKWAQSSPSQAQSP